jgi:hypothetical protein
MADTTDDIIAQVIALLRKLEVSAYARAEAETLARIVAAAQGGTHAATTPEIPDIDDNAERPLRRRPGGQPGMKRATRGSVRKYVNRVLADPNYRGANYDGIVAMVADLGGTDIAPASVRNFLRSSEKRGEVRRQNDLWFLSQPPWAREGEGRAVEQPGDSQPQ